MKLAFSTNAFKRYNLEDSIKEIAGIGYRGVEILCDVPHAYPPLFKAQQIISLKDTISTLGIQISNLNAFTLYAIGDVYHPSWIEKDNEGNDNDQGDSSSSARHARIQHTIDCIRLAKKIGGKCISTEPGGPISDTDPSISLHELEKIFLNGLTKVTEVAEEEDIKVLIEPEPFLLIENSQQFKNFMKNVVSDHIKLNFDIGHFYCVNENPVELIYNLSDYIEHFHLADIAENRVHNHLIPGKGSIDFLPIFEAMDKIGYDGFVTVELYPYQDNPVEAAREAYIYLCNMM
jgi:sugar phosphate isomerase/epimerase